MSIRDNNQENGLPLPDENRKTSVDFLPRFFKTESNKKFLQSTIDQLIQPGVAEKINGYFGRKTAKAFSVNDNYIGDVTDSRQNYQLEPAVVIKDQLDNVLFYKDYNDYVNQISAFGGDTSNHSLLNRQESYGWNPNIDWDKIVNYRDYYWLADGPDAVPVAGQSSEVISTYSVTLTGGTEATAYLFSPDGLTSNPRLTLYRGQTYRFDIDTPGYPIAFAISRTVVPGTALLVAGREGIIGPGLYDSKLYDSDGYDTGDFIVPPDPGSITFEADENVSTLFLDGIRKFNQDGDEIAVVYVEKGVIEFTVPFSAPSEMFYISQFDINVAGVITVANIEENTFLNVETEILGKKTYLSANGVEFSNGQKVKFTGVVEPESYAQGQWYVEGVGDRIKLINSDQFPELIDQTKDYIIINRASLDQNAWSRNNRWFHRQVIEQSSKINKTPFDLDENLRAKRPIIEFEPGLWLFNNGTYAKTDVDLIDTFTTDVFSTIEGSIGYSIDQVDLAQGMRVLFAADTDRLVNGKIYTVNFIEVNGRTQISLIETEDSEPLELETVFVRQGRRNAGKTYFYKDEQWKLSQEKTTTNQPPLFNLCCPNGREFGDTDVFESSSFTGTKVFSYKQGFGPVDPELGFPIAYRSIDNTGDIVFEMNLMTDSFTIQEADSTRVINTNIGYLRKYSDRETFEWKNSYSSIPTTSEQPVLRQYVVDQLETMSFEVDVFDNAALITDFKLRVFVNNRFKIKGTDYTVDRINDRVFVRFFNSLKENDVVLIKSVTETPKNSNGYYEFPFNLERNPKNEDLGEFTLGEITDHVGSIVEKVPGYQGEFPGSGNLRDLGELDNFGSRFVKHSGPINLPLYHITNKDFNIVNAIRHSKREYAKFKRNFISIASTLGFDGEPRAHVDKIFTKLNRDKVKTEPFYFSDMLATGAFTILEYKIVDPSNLFYGLSERFMLNELSPRSVLVYLNGEILTAHQDYSFDENGFLILTAGQKQGDIVSIYEYESTDGSYVPPTPSKLGLYPKFVPEILVDDTYITGSPSSSLAYKIYGQLENGKFGWFYPVYSSKTLAEQEHSSQDVVIIKIKGLSDKLYIPVSQSEISKNDTDQYQEYPRGVAVIKGHDGSVIRAFKDYRDALILELEKRIFNNIKVDYDSGFLDINNFIGGYYRNTGFTKEQIDNTLITDFIEWVKIVDRDYTVNDFYNRQNSFTYNYSNMAGPNEQNLPGFWRGIYIQAFDTDRPHAAPWEMLGYGIKPSWWNQVYGPAPYTSDNLILWNDLENGIIREPQQPVRVNQKYRRPGLTDNIPVDSSGRLKSPLDSGFAQNFFFRSTTQSFKFGDHSPVETAWRKSSEYPFAVILAWLLNNPTQITALGFDVSRIKRNFTNQLIYTETGKPIELDKLVFPNTVEDDRRVQTSGLVNYIYNLVASNVLTVYDDYRNQVKSIDNSIGFKIAGFTEKNRFRLLLDSRSPRQQLESSSFVPEENYQVFLNTSSPIDVISYSGVVIEKAPAGFIVRGYDQVRPYFEYFEPIKTANDITISVGGISETTTLWRPQRPYVRGQIIENNSLFYRVTRDFTSGTAFSVENLAQLDELPIIGGKRAQISRRFNSRRTLKLAYGTKLNSSQDVIDFVLGYAARLKSQRFDFNYFNPLTEVVENWEYSVKEFLFWTTQGWAAGTTISLSPSAAEISFKSEFSVVDDLYNGFYDYSILKSDGRPLEVEFNNVYREQNTFTLKLKNTDDGIYHIRLPLVQKEHVVLLDNKTVFSDLIYRPSSGYRQERIRALGYRTDGWSGSLNIPGFVFDDVKIELWTSWRDYNIGDVVKHKEFFYVAKENVPGSLIFEDRFWFRLNQKPESKLMTNFDYRINQFTDFYDLDSDGFDLEKQRLAQHLVSYQKRKYLENIINDDVSQFKFYQGFIREKGTANSISKLFDALSGVEKESLELYEEWAIQVGQYGAVDNFEQLEIQIDPSKMREVSQSFELVEQLPSDVFDEVYRVRPFELYEMPNDYNSNPFPIVDSVEEYLPTDGYVDINTIDYKVDNKTELANADANRISLNEYIWLTENGRNDWDVLQVFGSIARAESLTNEQRTDADGLPLWTFRLNRWARSLVEPGEFIAIKGAQFFGVFGFYEVDSVKFDKITVKANVNNAFAEFENQSFVITKLKSVRNALKNVLENNQFPVGTRSLPRFVTLQDGNIVVETRRSRSFIKPNNGDFDVTLRDQQVVKVDLVDQIVPGKFSANQRIWIDDFHDDQSWAVLENSPQYSKNQEIVNPSTDINVMSQQYGTAISVTSDNRSLFVSAPKDTDGKVYFYRRPDSEITLSQLQSFEPLTNIFDINLSEPIDIDFGRDLAVSSDGKFLAIGAPKASNIKTKFKGIFNSSSQYQANDIVKFEGSLWRANVNIAQGSQPPSLENDQYTQVFNIPADPSGESNGLESEGLIYIYRRIQTGQYVLSRAIVSEHRAAHKKFGSQVKFAKEGEIYKLYIGSTGASIDDEPNTRSIEIYYHGPETNDQFKGEWSQNRSYNSGDVVERAGEYYQAMQLISSQTATSLFDSALWKNISWRASETVFEFNKKFDVSSTGSVVVVATAQKANSSEAINEFVKIYRQYENSYLLDQTIESPNNGNKFADQIQLSSDGEFIAISETESDKIKTDQGKVFILNQIDGKFSVVQEIVSPNAEISEKFGYSISFNNDTLVVASLNGDRSTTTSFDSQSRFTTTFDRGFTQFNKIKKDSGSVYVFERLKNSLLYSEKLSFSADIDTFGENLLISDNHIYVSMPRRSLNGSKGLIIDYKKPKTSKTWNVIQEYLPPVDLQKINGISIYNKRTNQLIAELDYIDPIQGKIASIADREIDFKTAYDPAYYTSGIISSLVNPDLSWGEQHVGTVWWKVDSAKFSYPYFGSIQYQKNNWNKIRESSRVEVYEWVKSSVTPAEWDRISVNIPDNELGISGRTRYGDDFFSQKFEYDRETKTFRSQYYFWVRNKTSVPRNARRRLSVADIRRLIEDPRGQGYQFVNLLGANRFVVNNCESILTNKDVIISIKYRTNGSETQNRHIQYQLLADGFENSQVHRDVERKWFDSLIGFDEQFRPVPDYTIPEKQRYGIQNEPRQSIFVNRREALKQYIERVNLTLKENLIVDEYDISPLEDKQSMPSIKLGLYDLKIDSDEELRFVRNIGLEQAELNPIVVNGRISRVEIVNPGNGYVVPPSYQILGTGEDAEIELSINQKGQISQVEVLRRGQGYGTDTEISVRNFSVLVENDTKSRGKWAIYQWNAANRSWDRSRIQAFDVSLFWDYTDWYAKGYNEFTEINFTVDQIFEIDALNSQVEDIIKVNSVGTGGWLLIEKIADSIDEQFIFNYRTVGRQDGTIQFKSSLYDFENRVIGYDSRSYDSFLYDNLPIRELRIIFETVKNNLFIGSLLKEYNQLFIASLRYVLSEQLNADWLFKTGFVKIKHNVGNLEQTVNSKADSLDDYREYVEEVKPYTTNIREFVSAYTADDNTNSKVTDFDLSPALNPITSLIEPSKALISGEQLINVNESIRTARNQSWFDNFSHQVTEIKIKQSGSGYVLTPLVRIEGGGGTGAKAEAVIENGSVVRIDITDPGQGYVSTPQVIIEGSIGFDGSPASATAVIGDSVVRSINIGLKFDRIFGKYYFEDLFTVETFNGNDSDTFDLIWPMEINKRLVKVFINDRPVLRSEYTYTNVEDFTKTYVRKHGRIVFTNPPKIDDLIKVEYSKSFDLLSAEDRIQFGYNPVSGMPGQDLGQLMDGVDYGGVEVRSYGFDRTQGWDVEGWDKSSWDSFDESVDDEIFDFDQSVSSIELSTPLEDGIVYNVYLNGVRIDDPDFGTSSQTNPNAVVESIVGDGVTQQILIADLNISVSENDQLVIRKITSDGSPTPDPETYDFDISGGDLAYQTAQGINPEEIIIDGDQFVTPTTSKGPEELVPGQILDALDIRVFTSLADGMGVFYLQNHKLNSSRTYDLGVVPNSPHAVLVKVDDVILSDNSYTIDWTNNLITIGESVQGVDLNIITQAQSKQNVLDFGTRLFEESKLLYVTAVPFDSNLQVVATVRGERISITWQQDTETQNLAFQVDQPLDEEDSIDYIVFDGTIEENYSQVTRDQFVSDGSSDEFILSAAPFFSQPSLANVVVKVGNSILKSGYSIKYTITDQAVVVYPLEKFQVETEMLTESDISVFLNGQEITASQDWQFNSGNQEIELLNNVASVNDILEIFTTVNRQYNIIDDRLILEQVPSAGTVIEVFKYSNHDLLNIQRQNYEVIIRSIIQPSDVEYVKYQRLTRGEIKLTKTAVDSQYVWVAKNGNLLTPNVDYSLNDSKNKVLIAKKLKKNDVVEIIHFAASVFALTGFEFRLFKDMLNRTHYKRVDQPKTVLAEDLNYFDQSIQVANGAGLTAPIAQINRPGVIFINGERIEYFVKQGNTLSQLRRGTLGTGVKSVYKQGTPVVDQSASKTIPYSDDTQIQSIITDGETQEYQLDFAINTVNEIEVFVAGRRANKVAVEKFDPTLAQDSPEGDVELIPEFELVENNGDQFVKFNIDLPKEILITIIKKTGNLWSPLEVPLADANNDISRFLILPELAQS